MYLTNHFEKFDGKHHHPSTQVADPSPYKDDV